MNLDASTKRLDISQSERERERESRSTTENTFISMSMEMPLIHTILPLSFCLLVSYPSYSCYYSNDE